MYVLRSDTMPRNKYPEETVQKILDVSMKLFLEKGYEETTILDIVRELGGLTRGAFYHHFKSKEEVLDALSDRMFLEHNPFEEVRKDKELSGLEKLKKLIKMQAQNQDQLDLNQMSVPLLKNPKILADYMESNLRIVTPFFEELFLEGIQDGSIPDIKYPKALASLFVMITSVWFIPSIVPCTQEELLERLLLTKHLLDSMGIYLIDDEILQHAQTIVQSIPTK